MQQSAVTYHFAWLLASTIRKGSISAALTLSGSHADIRWSILLTKIDTYDPDVIGEDIQKTFHSARLESLVEVCHPLTTTAVHS